MAFAESLLGWSSWRLLPETDRRPYICTRNDTWHSGGKLSFLMPWFVATITCSVPQWETGTSQGNLAWCLLRQIQLAKMKNKFLVTVNSVLGNERTRPLICPTKQMRKGRSAGAEGGEKLPRVFPPLLNMKTLCAQRCGVCGDSEPFGLTLPFLVFLVFHYNVVVKFTSVANLIWTTE